MDWRIVPTEKQSAHLKKPWTFSVAALKSADFLARQDYIDWWIKEWLRQTLVAPDELPLCVAESIHCDRKLRRRLARSIKNAIVRGDVQYFKTHNLIPDAIVWNFVDFDRFWVKTLCHFEPSLCVLNEINEKYEELSFDKKPPKTIARWGIALAKNMNN